MDGPEPSDTGNLIAMLLAFGVRVDPGLSPAELASVEARHGFRFAAEHRALLAAGLPVGERWPNWRNGPAADLRDMLGRPRDGLLFDVEHNDFWPRSWGPAHPTTAPNPTSFDAGAPSRP